jgi:hypothetical protein
MNQSLTIDATSGSNINGVTLTQQAQISTQAMQSAQTVSSMQTDLINQLQQSAVMSSPAVLSAFSDSQDNVNAYISNEVQNKLTSSVLQQCALNINQDQSVTIIATSSTVSNVDVSQVIDAYSSCVSSALTSNDFLSTISNAGDQTSNNVSTNPISDILNSIFSGINSIISPTHLMMLIAFIVLIAVVLIAYKFHTSHAAHAPQSVLPSAPPLTPSATAK